MLRLYVKNPNFERANFGREKTNPVSKKILIICSVSEITPYELLGGTENIRYE